MFARISFTLSLLTCLAVSCKKTVEWEAKNWGRTVAEAQRTLALHPGFSAVLNAEIETALAPYGANASIAEEESRAEARASARQTLQGGIFKLLTQVTQHRDKLTQDAMRVLGSTRSLGDALGKGALVAQANQAVADAEKVLKTGAPDSVAAHAVLAKASWDLGLVQSVITEALAEIQAKRVGSGQGASRSGYPGSRAAAADQDSTSREEASGKETITANQVHLLWSEESGQCDQVPRLRRQLTIS